MKVLGVRRSVNFRGVFSRLLRSKKGFFAQVLFGIVILFSASFVWVSSFMIQDTLNTELQGQVDLTNQSKQVMEDQTDAMPSVFDGGLALVMVLVFLLVFAFAYKASENPVFLVLAILIIAAVGFAGMILSNAWSDYSSTEGMSSASSSFPITDFILSNFLIVILVLCFGGVLVYFYSTGGFG